MPYIGGKSQSGVWQRIINLIPPHETFLELFGGDAAIARRKRPAARTVIVEKSAAVTPKLALIAGAQVVTGCGIEFLESFDFTASGRAFIYADPPYVLSARNGRRYYEHEMTDAEHIRLLDALKRAPCPVLLSGYASALYTGAGFGTKRTLPGWTCETFRVMTRGHTWRTECLWFNYPRPETLHDLAHVGADYRERWRIEKRRRTQRARFLRMSRLERAALFSALVDVMESAGDSAENSAARS